MVTRALLIPSWLGLAALHLVPQVARADSPPPAPIVCELEPHCVEQVQRGLEQAATDREAALAIIQDAYRLYPDPRLRYNLGRLLQQLHRPTEASRQYRSFLEAGVENRPEIVIKARTYLEQTEREAAAVREGPPFAAAVAPHAQQAIEKRPLYKKWWFWTAIGGGALAVAAIGLGVGLAQRKTGFPVDINTYAPSF